MIKSSHKISCGCSNRRWIKNKLQRSYRDMWHEIVGRVKINQIGPWNWVSLHVFQWDRHFGWWDRVLYLRLVFHYTRLYCGGYNFKITYYYRPLGYKRVFPLIFKMADTPFHIQGDDIHSTNQNNNYLDTLITWMLYQIPYKLARWWKV